jgi:hypothetical protein
MSEDDIFHHAVRGHQLAVLVNHPDAQIDGIQRRPESDLLATEENLTLVGLQYAKEDFHQSGFTSAVLPQDRVNLPRFYLKIDMVISDDSWESLRDSPCLYDRFSALDAFQECITQLSLFLISSMKIVLLPEPKSINYNFENIGGNCYYTLL